ncbi:hypothetical protein GCM10009547_47300 [Sporichthya brevicatena]|uniref:Uncharacterized protein n=1 Tax=Sporichthya brevicatena TaxID=171442 RepID=A0ABN1HBY7_9ACTN
MTVAPERPASTAAASLPLTGADEIRFAHIEAQLDALLPRGGTPVHDSVVIAGGKGITAWTLAARLARSEQFAGKVVVAGEPVTETRQIANGCSMRGTSADWLSYAVARPQAELIRRIAGPAFAGQPVATRQLTAMARPGIDGQWEIGPAAAWQGGRRGSNRPVMYGGRNSRMAGAMREMLDAGAIVDVDEPIRSLDDARALAPGRKPLFVNLTKNPKLFGGSAPPIKRVTLAWQCALRAGSGGLRHPLTGTTAFAPLVYRDGAVNVGYFTPFADPLSPDATWYGLMVRPVRSGPEKIDKAREVAALREEVLGIAEAVGLEPVDLEETCFGGLAPAPAFGAPKRSAPGTLELRRLATPGAIAYYADGILGGAIGGVVAAEALIRGHDPHDAVVKALKPIRWFNDLWWFETARIPKLVDLAIGTSRLTTRIAMAYPHSYSLNHWASRA